MDTWTPEQQKAQAVQEGLQTIKARMPNVYAAIKARAAEAGQGVYGLVRRGLRGEPQCFWALEAGHVVGAPFDGHELQPQVAALMVQFGCSHVVMFGNLEGAGHGAH